GAAFDRKRSGTGIARAIRAALGDAGIQPREIDHINAYGASDIQSDAIESKALAEVFGDSLPAVPVFAPKSYFGNLGAGSASVELATSLLALAHGELPPSLNYDEPDPACSIHVTAGEARRITKT